MPEGAALHREDGNKQITSTAADELMPLGKDNLLKRKKKGPYHEQHPAIKLGTPSASEFEKTQDGAIMCEAATGIGPKEIASRKVRAQGEMQCFFCTKKRADDENFGPGYRTENPPENARHLMDVALSTPRLEIEEIFFQDFGKRRFGGKWDILLPQLGRLDLANLLFCDLEGLCVEANPHLFLSDVVQCIVDFIAFDQTSHRHTSCGGRPL
jgi:hypothetical protein